MQKWQYGMALYKSRANERVMLDFHNSDLAMDDIDSSKGISLTYFLKAAGEQGWELTSVLYPWAVGQRFTEGSEEEEPEPTWTVEDRYETQWLIFKRPMR
jgi:hypothetical protein